MGEKFIIMIEYVFDDVLPFCEGMSIMIDSIYQLEKIKCGIDQVNNTVKVTLGPKGRNVALAEYGRIPIITNDGEEIIKSIELKDMRENIGAQLIKEMTNKIQENVGDGKTMAVVLTQAIVAEGMKKIAFGANPVILRRGLERAVQVAVEELKKLSVYDISKEQIRNIVSVAAKDDEIGGLIAEALEKIQDTNGIVIENSATFDSYLEFKEGFSLNKGYLSASMMNDEEASRCIYEDVDILIVDKALCTFKDVEPILTYVLQRKKPLLLIVDALEEEALQVINMNNKQGIFSVVAIQAPTYGDNRENELLDIEALVGGQAIVGKIQDIAEKISPEFYGHADKVIVEKNKTTIIGGRKDLTKINYRIKKIYEDSYGSSSEFTDVIFKNRLRRLLGNTAVIKIGSATEVEFNERKQCAMNALRLIQAVFDEGIVAGGGVIYLQLSLCLQNLFAKQEDEQMGIDIFLNALKAPITQLLTNAGKEASVIIGEIMDMSLTKGYDVISDSYNDMFKKGIVDSTKVVRTILQDASSMAAMVLTIGNEVGVVTAKK